MFLFFFDENERRKEQPVSSKKKSFSGNRGEWSEPYTVLRLLADSRLSQATDDLRPSTTEFAQVLALKRGDLEAVVEQDGEIRFEYTDKYGQHHSVSAAKDTIGIDAKRLFKSILAVDPDAGAFELPEEAARLKVYGFTRLTNPAPKKQKVTKRDLTLRLLSPNLGAATLGFSIKSEIGAPPTLLNASEATNIIYRVKGLTAGQAKEINTYGGSRKIMDRCALIKAYASSIEFEKFNNGIFHDNLDLIDSSLPQMIADLTKAHYFEQILEPRKRGKGGFREADTLSRAVEIISSLPRYSSKPQRNYCQVKIKRFIRACALGLLPSEVWCGEDDASGGYIIVLPDGNLIALYVYNTNLFEKYLFENTIFERASTTRHKYMELKPDGETGDYLLKLNLQVRFRK